MKRLFLLLVPLMFAMCVFFPAGTASAETDDVPRAQYAVVNKRNVCFYKFPDENSALFVLPYTYFVRVISDEDDFLRVQYAADRDPYRAVEGYCLKEDVEVVDFLPQTPYLECTVDLVYTIGDPGGEGAEDLLSVTKTFAYYGHIYEQSYLYYCVLDGGELKRVPAHELLDYTLNNEYSDYVAGLPASAQAEEEGLSAAAIVAICVACVAAVAVAVLVARGKRPPSHDPERAEF